MGKETRDEQRPPDAPAENLAASNPEGVKDRVKDISTQTTADLVLGRWKNVISDTDGRPLIDDHDRYRSDEPGNEGIPLGNRVFLPNDGPYFTDGGLPETQEELRMVADRCLRNNATLLARVFINRMNDGPERTELAMRCPS